MQTEQIASNAWTVVSNELANSRARFRMTVMVIRGQTSEEQVSRCSKFLRNRTGCYASQGQKHGNKETWEEIYISLISQMPNSMEQSS
jgi:hypothetical protein